MFNFIYDPQRQGYDTGVWKTITGTPAIVGDDLSLNASTIIQEADCLRGTYNFQLTVPVAPTAGDDRKFGLMSLSKSVYAIFNIVDDALICYIKNEDGNINSQVVEWDSAWDATSALFQVKWYGNGISFYIDHVQVAVFNEELINTSLSPYVSNANADSLLVTFVEGVNVDTYIKSTVAVQLIDNDGSPITSLGGGGSSGGASGAILLGADIGGYTFDASAKTVTITGMGTVKLSQIFSIVNLTDQTTIYSPTDEDKGGTLSSNVLTLEFDTTAMSDADLLQIFIQYNNSEDFSTNNKKVTVSNQDSEKSTSPEPYTELTATAVAFVEGSVISVDGFNYLNYAFSKTISTADDSYLKITYLNEAGVVDYQETVLGTTTAGITPITPHLYLVDKAALVNIVSFPTKGYPYMRIDLAKATDTGTDAVFTGEINKSYL